MTFLKALFLALVVTLTLFIIVYIHIVIALSIYNLARYKVKEKKNPFLYGWEYKGKSVLKLFASIFILLHFLLFIDYYRSYINEKTKYHDAKVYYAVGLIPHTYSVLLGQFVTPLNPLFLSITKPTNAMKEYLFEKGIQHIPNTDAERELWEYEWFFYPYAIRFSDMYDRYYYGRNEWGDPSSKITRETHNYMYARIERLYEIIEALNTKKIDDLYREADSIKKLPLMVYYYDRKAQFFVYHKLVDWAELQRDKKKQWISITISEVRDTKFIEWLQSLSSRMDHHIQFQEWGDENFKALFKLEATRQMILLDFLESAMYNKIKTYNFHCNNEVTQDYIKLRNKFFGKNSVLNFLAAKGGKEEALWMYDSARNTTHSYFFKLILKKYCATEVYGEPPYKSEVLGFHEKNILDPNKEIIKILETGEVK